MTDNGEQTKDTTSTDISLENLIEKSEFDGAFDQQEEQEEEQDASETADDDSRGTTDSSDSSDDSDGDAVGLKAYIIGLNSHELSDEDAETRDQLLETFGGVNIDNQGNIVNSRGEIVAEFDDVEQYTTDGGFYDRKGNLVDVDGSIIKTKEELREEVPFINEFYEESGFELVDEDGKPKQYGTTKEDLKNLTLDLGKAIGNDLQTKFFESNPTIKEVAKHILSGGDINDFQKSKDYLSLDADKLSEVEKVSYIRQSFKALGMSEETINRNIKRIEQANDVDEEFKEAIAGLQAEEDLKQEQRDIKYREKIKADNEKVVKYWEEVNSIVEQGNLASITIPEKERKKFFDYLSTPVEGNKSQEMIDREKEDKKTKIELAYLRYKNYDLSKMIKQEAKNSNVQSLRERLKTYKDTDKSVRRGGSTSRSHKGGDISLDNMLR